MEINLLHDSFHVLNAARGKKSLVSTNDHNQLEYLGTKIKDSHNRVLAHLSQALRDARNCGEFLGKARPIWQKLRASGKCKLKWEEWLLENAGISRNTANNYLRIYVNFDQLEGLPVERQSITAAIEHLRSLKGGSTQRITQAGSVNVTTADLLTIVAKYEVGVAIDPIKLIALLNEVLKAAQITKTIMIKDTSE